MTGIIALHRALYHPAPWFYALRQRSVSGKSSSVRLSTPGKRGVHFEERTGGQSWERYEVPTSGCPRIPIGVARGGASALPSRVYGQGYRVLGRGYRHSAAPVRAQVCGILDMYFRERSF